MTRLIFSDDYRATLVPTHDGAVSVIWTLFYRDSMVQTGGASTHEWGERAARRAYERFESANRKDGEGTGPNGR